MKYLVLIIALVMLGGCASSSPATSNSNTLNADEQAALDFIIEHIPELDQIYDMQMAAVEDTGNLNMTAATVHIDTYVAHWNLVKKEWEAFPAAGGQTMQLELLFENTANDLRDINMGMLDILQGSTNNAAIKAVRAYASDRTALDDELATF